MDNVEVKQAVETLGKTFCEIIIQSTKRHNF